MKPFTFRNAVVAMAGTLGVAVALSAAAAPGLLSEKNLEGIIEAQPTQFDVLDGVTDSDSTFISNSFGFDGGPAVASYIGDTRDGRLGVNIDVSGGAYANSSAVYTESVTNTTAGDLDLTFSFYLRPGQLQFSGLPLPEGPLWEGTMALSGRVMWGGEESGDILWSVAATVLGFSGEPITSFTDVSNAPGFGFTETDTGLTYDAYQYTVALGKLGAGQTKTLTYSLYAEGFYNEECQCERQTSFVAALDGALGGSAHVGALDPFGVVVTPGIQYLAVAVPEPETWAMVAVGLLAAAGVARRRVTGAARERSAA